MDIEARPVISHQNVRLRRGAHRSPSDGACVMELVSMLAGESFGDRPRTACPVIGAFLRAYNDLVGDDQRQDLLRCAAAVVGSRRTEAERERIQRCVEVAVECHQALPRWRRALGGLRLAQLLDIRVAPITDGDLEHLGRSLALLLRRSADGHAQAVALVEELAALGTHPAAGVDAETPVLVRA